MVEVNDSGVTSLNGLGGEQISIDAKGQPISSFDISSSGEGIASLSPFYHHFITILSCLSWLSWSLLIVCPVLYY